MTTQFSIRRFRLLAVGGAKARTNDNSGQQAIEQGLVKYDHP